MWSDREGSTDPLDRVDVLLQNKKSFPLNLIKSPQQRIARTEANGFISSLYGPLRPTQEHVRPTHGQIGVYIAGVQKEGMFRLDNRLFVTILCHENPRLGEVSVPEEGYQKIQDLLNSDDPTDHERAFALLQRTQDQESAGGAEDAPQSTGPTSMLPPGVFAIIHPPARASSSAGPSNAPDLAEPLSLDHPPPKDRERGLW